MVTIEKLPPTYKSNPAGWYAACWRTRAAHCYRTKPEAIAKARELDSDIHGHIVNVSWLARPGDAHNQIGTSFRVVDHR